MIKNNLIIITLQFVLSIVSLIVVKLLDSFGIFQIGFGMIAIVLFEFGVLVPYWLLSSKMNCYDSIFKNVASIIAMPVLYLLSLLSGNLSYLLLMTSIPFSFFFEKSLSMSYAVMVITMIVSVLIPLINIQYKNIKGIRRGSLFLILGYIVLVDVVGLLVNRSL